MTINNDIKLFKVIAKTWAKPKLKGKVVSVFGEKAFPRLVLLEEKFYAAYLCYKRLRNRSKRYNNLKLTPNILANNSLRTLHSDEYFFFTSCNFIYNEILLLKEQKLLLNLPLDFLNKLKVLKEERRYHEHGKEWYWGKIPSGGTVSSRGDNFDFDRNMKLIRDIYSFIISKIDKL